MKKLDDMIADLLDMDIVKADNKVAFSNEARQLIHEIAEMCSAIPIVDETREQAAVSKVIRQYIRRRLAEGGL